MIRTVIVGAGGIALKHVESLNKLPNIQVAGVIDVSHENARRIANKCNAKVVSGLEDIIDEVQMIHLLTPPSERVKYAELAMKAGKHVLCEKPIAVDLADAVKMVNLAKENNVIFMTAFNMRFRPGYLRLQDDVRSGKLGDIVTIWSHRIGPGPGFNAFLGDTWRTDRRFACGMSIESLSHDIDMFRGLGVEIISVAATVKGLLPEIPAFDNNAQVLMKLDQGGSAIINASWSSRLSMYSIGVIGTRGTAAITGKNFFDFTEYRIFTEDMDYEQIIRINDLFDNESSYYSENKYFIECIENASQPFITAENGLEALKVSLAILEANNKHQTVKLMDA